jgi:Flp pilus assembly protein TadD
MRLGHYRAARRAFEKALRVAPEDASALHNLGHLLDVAFDLPAEALPHLTLACRVVPDEPSLASSLAHALARTGQKARAEQVLVRNARLSPGLAHATVESWLGKRKR